MADLRAAAALALVRMQRLLVLLGPSMPDRSEFAAKSARLTELRRTLLQDRELTRAELERIAAELHSVSREYDAAAERQGSIPAAGLPETADAFRTYAEAAELHFGFLAGRESQQFRGGLLSEYRVAADPSALARVIALDILTSASEAIAISKIHLLRAAVSLEPEQQRRQRLLNAARDAILDAMSDAAWEEADVTPALGRDTLLRHARFESVVSERRLNLPLEVRGSNALFPNRPLRGWEEQNSAAVAAVLDDLSRSGSLFLDSLSPGGRARKVAIKIELNVGIDGPPSVTDPVVTGATVYELLERGFARGVPLHLTVGDSCGIENAPVGRTSMDIMRETGNFHYAVKGALRFLLRRDEDGARREAASSWLNAIAALESEAVFLASPADRKHSAGQIEQLESLLSPALQCVDYDETGFVPIRTQLGALGLAVWGTRDFHVARPWVEADHRVHVTRGCSTHLFAGWTGAVKGLIGLHALGLRPADQALNELGQSALDMLVAMMHLSGFNGILGTKSRVGDLNVVSPDDAVASSTERWRGLSTSPSLLKGWHHWVEQTFVLERELRADMRRGAAETEVMAKMRRLTRGILDEADRRSPGFRNALWTAVADGTRSGLLATWRVRNLIPVNMRDERMGMRIGVLTCVPIAAELVIEGLPKIGIGGGPDAYERVQDVGVLVAGTDEVAVDLTALRSAGLDGNPWEYYYAIHGSLQFGRGAALWDEIRLVGGERSTAAAE